MASVYPRGKTQWIKFYPPGHSEPSRVSLGTPDPALAKLICRRVELELKLRQPEIRSVHLPPKITNLLGLAEEPNRDLQSLAVPAASSNAIEEAPSPDIEEVLIEYIAYIRVENSNDHAANKIGHLKKFFGCKRVGVAGTERGSFTGKTLGDVKVGDVRRFIDGLPVGTKTKKHHKETFHSLFEFAMKYGFFVPVNFRYPNPMAGLPGYHDKNKPIVYLTNAQVELLLEILKPCPPVQVAAALMIYAGLRRAEALWLTRKDFAPDLRFFSVVNKTDSEQDIESTLKTGERAVPILPALKAILEPYLAERSGDWLVPSPTGLQWDGDNFAEKHRKILRANNLEHTCLHYRHTFATQRAADGWTLFRISKTMGNSIAVCEKYYAAFIDPTQM